MYALWKKTWIRTFPEIIYTRSMAKTYRINYQYLREEAVPEESYS